MTGLGAAIYAGFFGIAALWLFLTSDYRVRFATHRPQHSSTVGTSVDSEEYDSWVLSHSTTK